MQCLEPIMPLALEQHIHLNCTPMTYLQRLRKLNSTLWVLLLSVALACVQSVKLHVHTIDHENHQQQNSISTQVDSAAQHSHLSDAHLATNTSHGDHHDEFISELDVSPDGFLKKLSSNIFILALIATIVMLLLQAIGSQLCRRRDNNHATVTSRYLLSPPLRAPPL